MSTPPTDSPPNVVIDQQKCVACGLCSTVCPRRVLVTHRKEGKKPHTEEVAERLDLCLGCGQCVAVCSTGAVTVAGLSAEAFEEAPKSLPSPEQLTNLMLTRRSVRRYRDKPVPRDLLEKVVRAASMAPPAEGRVETGLIVVQDPKLLDLLSQRAYSLYEKLDKGLSNPIGRMVIKHKVGAAMIDQLTRFVLPGVRWYAKWYQANEGDELRRDAPVVMLFTGPRGKALAGEDALLAAYHAVLMAHAVGLGACVNGLIPPACNRDEQLREALQLPSDVEVLESLTLGFPRVRYRKSIERKLGFVRWS